MSILSMLFGSADDVARQMASQTAKSAAKSTAKNVATGVAKKAATNYSDDVASAGAKQAAKATAKAGKSTPAQKLAKSDFDDYMSSFGASTTQRKRLAKSTYNGVTGKTKMYQKMMDLNADPANIADKSLAGKQAYGGVIDGLFGYMDDNGVGVDLSDLKGGSNLFTKSQKTRLAQAGMDLDNSLSGTLSPSEANNLYKTARDLGYRLTASNDATQSILGDRLMEFSGKLRDKIDDAANSVAKSYGLKQKFQDAANSIGDISLARQISGMTDDAIKPSMVRAEQAPYMEMEQLVGQKAPTPKTLQFAGFDTGIESPLPKASAALRRVGLQVQDKLSGETGKNAALVAAAGGAGILGGLLGGSSGSGSGSGGITLSGASADPYSVALGGSNGYTDQSPYSTTATEPNIGGYTYDDLDNAYASAIMAGDTDAAAIIAEMTSALDAKIERQVALSGSEGGSSGIGSKQQAAIGVLNSLMGNFQAQGPVQGVMTNLLNAVTGGNYNYQIANYQDQGKASLGMLIKAMGDSGTLSDGDTQRALGLIPDNTDTPEKAQNKYDTLMQMLLSAGQGG